jgi:hypothetical protein
LGSKTNWAAVSAFAAIGGFLVAFLAYAAPHHVVPVPQPAPTPFLTTAPVPPLGPVTATSEVTPFQGSGPLPSLAALQPAGCAKALPIVDTYYRTAGTTKYTQEAAARQAAQDMFNATVGLQGGPAFADITALYNDFASMEFILLGESPRNYSDAQAQTNADRQTLYSVCGSS